MFQFIYKIVLFFIIFNVLPLSVQAADFRVLYGAGFNGKNSTFAVQSEFTDTIIDSIYYQISYLNQGHYIGHSSDGLTGEIGYFTFLGKAKIGVGVGVYAYCDTQIGQKNAHGIAPITSVWIDYPITKSFFLTAQGNYIQENNYGNFTILSGIGYSFSSEIKNSIYSQELSLLAGISIVDGSQGHNNIASGIEYRNHITDWIDFSLRALGCGDTEIISVGSEIWLVKKIGYFTVGIGSGIFIANTSNLVVSMLGSYDITDKIVLRATWDRILTTINQDKEIGLIGIGYRF